jgi:hypothetical protein
MPQSSVFRTAVGSFTVLGSAAPAAI